MDYDQPDALTENEVHVWHLDVSSNPRHLLKQAACLSLAEKDKSARIKAEADRLLYVVRHVFLRQVLAGYLKIGCNEIIFIHNDFGKPFLADSVNAENLQFSLSKSRDHVLLAINRKRPIGCDIEKQDTSMDFKSLIKHYFSAQEFGFILENSRQPRRFYDYWTAREAYVKARGEGLSIPLDQFSIYIDDNDNITMLENHVYPDDRDKWQIRQLTVCKGFSAALAVEGDTALIRQIDVII